MQGRAAGAVADQDPFSDELAGQLDIKWRGSEVLPHPHLHLAPSKLLTEGAHLSPSGDL